MSYPNEFLKLQTSVIDRLTADVSGVPAPTPAAGSVTWISEVLGDIVTAVKTAVAKLGIAGIILTPGGDRLSLYDPRDKIGVLSMQCPVLIEIQENVTINRGPTGTGIQALDLVRFCLKRLNRWSYDSDPATALQGRKPTWLVPDPKPFELVESSPLLVYHVRFTTSLSIV